MTTISAPPPLNVSDFVSLAKKCKDNKIILLSNTGTLQAGYGCSHLKDRAIVFLSGTWPDKLMLECLRNAGDAAQKRLDEKNIATIHQFMAALKNHYGDVDECHFSEIENECNTKPLTARDIIEIEQRIYDNTPEQVEFTTEKTRQEEWLAGAFDYYAPIRKDELPEHPGNLTTQKINDIVRKYIRSEQAEAFIQHATGFITGQSTSTCKAAINQLVRQNESLYSDIPDSPVTSPLTKDMITLAGSNVRKLEYALRAVKAGMQPKEINDYRNFILNTIHHEARYLHARSCVLTQITQPVANATPVTTTGYAASYQAFPGMEQHNTVLSRRASETQNAASHASKPSPPSETMKKEAMDFFNAHLATSLQASTATHSGDAHPKLPSSEKAESLTGGSASPASGAMPPPPLPPAPAPADLLSGIRAFADKGKLKKFVPGSDGIKTDRPASTSEPAGFVQAIKEAVDKKARALQRSLENLNDEKDLQRIDFEEKHPEFVKDLDRMKNKALKFVAQENNSEEAVKEIEAYYKDICYRASQDQDLKNKFSNLEEKKGENKHINDIKNLQRQISTIYGNYKAEFEENIEWYLPTEDHVRNSHSSK